VVDIAAFRVDTEITAVPINDTKEMLICEKKRRLLMDWPSQ